MQAASKRAYISRKAIASLASAKSKLNQKKAMPKQKMMGSDDSDELSDQEYQRNNLSCEMVDSDELEGDLNLSECEDAEEVVNVRKEAKKKRRNKGRKFQQEIDTNIFKIGFSTLKENAEIATGDPTFCKGCQAVLNSFSKVVDVDENL
jgi:hypothetical protein